MTDAHAHALETARVHAREVSDALYDAAEALERASTGAHWARTRGTRDFYDEASEGMLAHAHMWAALANGGDRIPSDGPYVIRSDRRDRALVQRDCGRKVGDH